MAVKKRWITEKRRRDYANNVRRYLMENSFSIVKKIYDGTLATQELKSEQVEMILGEDYPVAPWVDEKDIVGQFVEILKEAGYIFSYNRNDPICFKDAEIYATIVKNYLKLSGDCFVETLGYECERTNGKLTYFQIYNVLGLHYPKAPYVNKEDTRACILLFLKETGIPFKFDDTHVYFP